MDPREHRTTTESASGPKARSKTRRYLVAAALLGGGVTLGAVLSPIGLAGAQSSDDATTTQADDGPEAEDGTDTGRRDGRHRHGHPGRHLRFQELPELLGLEPEELRAAFEDGKTIAEVAEEQGVGTDELVAELVAGVEERLADAVANERIDQATADDKLAEIEERVEDFVTSEPGADGFPERPHRHHGHPHRHGLPGLGGGELADILGLTPEELRAELIEGKTLAQIGEEQGIGTAELVDLLVAEATEAIDQAVADGKVPAERAEQVKDQLDERLTNLVNGVPGEHDHPHGHPGRPGRPGRLGANQGPGGGLTEGETVESTFTA